MDTLKKKIYHFIFSWLNKALIDYICNKRNIKEAGERKIEDNPRENITKQGEGLNKTALRLHLYFAYVSGGLQLKTNMKEHF